jgi:hypothetical protein
LLALLAARRPPRKVEVKRTLTLLR